MLYPTDDNVDTFPERDMVPLQIIMSAHDIPDGSTITKKTGQKPYVIKSKIKIYAEQKSGLAPQILEAPGVKYLIDDSGNINAVSSEAEVMWHTTTGELLRFLDEFVNPEEDK
jgi:hypothetical protein